MFKKLLSMCLCLVFLTSSSFASSPAEGLQAAIDEFKFQLSSEWDGQDQLFLKTQVKKFESTLIRVKEQGLTNEHIFQIVSSNISDPRLSKNFQELATMVEMDELSPQGAAEQFTEILKGSQLQGASWDGYGTYALVIVGGFAAVCFLGIFIFNHS